MVVVEAGRKGRLCTAIDPTCYPPLPIASSIVKQLLCQIQIRILFGHNELSVN